MRLDNKSSLTNNSSPSVQYPKNTGRKLSTRSSSVNFIPYPHLQSHFHKRILIPHMSWEEKLERWKKKPPKERFLISLMSRVIKFLGLLKKDRKWAYLGCFYRFLHYYFRATYHIEVRNKEKIPKEGAIFYINHIAEIDVVLPFLAAFRKPIGIFTEIGDNLIVDALEQLGFVARRGSPAIMIEKMVRSLLLENRYFAIWPEGTPDKGRGIMQGFSGIVKVYATVNADRDRVPFVPVLMDYVGGSPRYFPFFKVKRKNLSKETLKRIWKRRIEMARKLNRKICFKDSKKIIFTILDPVFLPREWLRPPSEGGKTAREIIDYLMLILAKEIGQKELAPNPILEARRKQAGKPWDH